MAELKVEISLITAKIMNDVSHYKVSEEDIGLLSEMLLDQENMTSKDLTDWADYMSGEISPKSCSLLQSFLFERRWDMAFLNETDHYSLVDYIAYSEDACGLLIQDKIREAIVQAEEVAAKEKYLLKYMKKVDGDFLN